VRLRQPDPVLDYAPRETPLPYSVYVGTGTGNGQAYYKLDKPVTQRDALRVRRSAGAGETWPPWPIHTVDYSPIATQTDRRYSCVE
jgi:hypothetical protein